MSAKTLEEVVQILQAERQEAERLATMEYPAPEVTSRDPWSEDVVAPRPAVGLRLLAETHGFTVTMTYARGCPPHARSGKPLGLCHSVAVRMVHPETRRAAIAVATSPVARSDWSWDTVLLWGEGHPLFPFASITDAKGWIKARGEVDARWFGAIRRRIRETEVKAKAARPKGSGRKKGVMS